MGNEKSGELLPINEELKKQGCQKWHPNYFKEQQMDKLNFYTVKERYVKYMSQFDKRISKS